MIAWLLDKIEADGQAESSHNVALGLTIGSICKIVDSHDFDAQKGLLLEIFGSNLLQKDKNVVACSDGKIKSPTSRGPETSRLATSCHRRVSLRNATGTSHPETAWSALRAANQKAALAGDKMDFFSSLATVYEKSRTYFQRNGG